MARPSQIQKLPEDEQDHAKSCQKAIASVRAKVEHVFATVKKLFGWRHTRYRGLMKNIAKMDMLFALSNIWKASRVAKTAQCKEIMPSFQAVFLLTRPLFSCLSHGYLMMLVLHCCRRLIPFTRFATHSPSSVFCITLKSTFAKPITT